MRSHTLSYRLPSGGSRHLVTIATVQHIQADEGFLIVLEVIKIIINCYLFKIRVVYKWDTSIKQWYTRGPGGTFKPAAMEGGEFSEMHALNSLFYNTHTHTHTHTV